MPHFFQVTHTDIEQLTDIQLTHLLKRLLHLEARKFVIPQQAVDVSLKITVSDGGEDGRIKWNGDPIFTDYFPKQFTLFQCKATDMTASKCKNEILTKDKQVKQQVAEVLTQDGAYILFYYKSLSTTSKDSRILKIKEGLQEANFKCYDTAIIDIYDANKIASWVNTYISAIVLVGNFIGKTFYLGAKTLEEWESTEKYSEFSYVADNSRENYITAIQNTLKNKNTSIRVIGPSGLGKTRLVYEALKNDGTEKFLDSEVAYFDINCCKNEILLSISDLIREKISGILVLDNCDLQTHQSIQREIERSESLLRMISIDYYMDKDDSRTIVIDRMATKHVKAIIEQKYKDLPDLDRIATFAQGFPQMAVLLCEARLRDDPQMGSLTNDIILKKLLWGRRTSNKASRSAIEGCALFEKFGLKEDVKHEYEYIASSLLKIDACDLYREIQHFTEQKIIDIRHRYAQVVPQPLAIRLCAEWWKNTPREIAVEIITDENMPPGLHNSLGERISKLDFLPEFKQVVTSLSGETGPFGQAEVLKSVQGSRLFRALVEVNPEATADALYRTFFKLSDSEISKIKGDVRRNIVISLEKLCFRSTVFYKSCSILLRFATNENEPWSNNATGFFLQLFNIYLSGTEANPEERLRIIDMALESDNIKSHELAINALGNSFNIHHFSRSGGAEYQGCGQVLKDWEPKTYGEMYNYWHEAILRLTNIACSKSTLAEMAKNTVGQIFRPLIQYGRVEDLDYAFNTITASKGTLWLTALDNIKNALSFEKDHLPPEGISKLEEWKKLLLPENLDDKITMYVKNPSFEHEKDENGHYIDIAAVEASDFAVKASREIDALLQHINLLLTGELRQGYSFGIALAQSALNYDTIINACFREIKKVKTSDLNCIFIASFLSHIADTNRSQWDIYLQKIVRNKKLIAILPDVLRLSKPSYDDLLTLSTAINKKLIPVTSGRAFTYGDPLRHLPVDQAGDFALTFTKHKPNGPWVALDILFMYSFGRPNLFRFAFKYYNFILSQLEFTEQTSKHLMDIHQFKKVCKLLIESGSTATLKKITLKFTQAIESDSFSSDSQSIHDIVKYLFQKNFNASWHILGNWILQSKGASRLRYIYALHSRVRNSPSPGILENTSCHNIIKISNDNNTLLIVGKLIQVFEGSNTWSLTPCCKKLIDIFGNNTEFLKTLHFNFSSYTWCGNTSSYHKKIIGALSLLTDHHFDTVKQWANQEISSHNISYELDTLREQEEEMR